MPTELGEPVELTGLRVLVVEDEELIAMLLEDLLGELGCAVVGPAATVADAMALAGTEKIAGALLDLNLNGEPVYPVADSLTERGIPFIFTTGYGQENLISRHASVPTLTKPFSQRLLGDAMISRFLGGSNR